MDFVGILTLVVAFACLLLNLCICFVVCKLLQVISGLYNSFKSNPLADFLNIGSNGVDK